MARTVTQNRLIHVNKSRVDITEEDFRGLVSKHTGGETSKTSEMDEWQADKLIRELKAMYADKLPAIKRMRSKCLYLASEAFEFDLSEGSEDWNSFNNWMKRQGKHKKLLAKLTHDQLVETVSQLEKVLENVNKSKFGKYVNSELSDLNISKDEKAED